MVFRSKILATASILLTFLFAGGCDSGFESIDGVTTTANPPTMTTTVSAGFLKDIHSGVAESVSSGWIKMGNTLYFINNPAVNPGHQIWASTATGVATQVIDLGYENYVTQLIVDDRASASPSRFYFVVNETQLWTSDGTNTSKIAEYDD